MIKFLKIRISYYIYCIKAVIVFSSATILVLTLSSIKSSAVTNYKINNLNNTATLYCEGNTPYITSYTNDKYSITYITSSDCESSTITTQGKIVGITVNNNTVYALSDSNGKLILSCYIIQQDICHSYNLGNLPINSDYLFAVCNSNIYIPESNTKTINCYNFNGEKQYSLTVKDSIYLNAYNSNLYIYTKNKIYTHNNGKLEEIKSFGNLELTPNIYRCDNIICDFSGCIFNLGDNTAISTGIRCNKTNLGIINGYYCRYNNGTIYGYTPGGKVYSLYKTDFNCDAQMCSSSNTLYLLSENSEFIKLNLDDLNFPQTPTELPTEKNETTSNSNVSNDNNNTSTIPTTATKSSRFSINSYNVDSSKNIIWSIPPSTTIAQLKSNITLEGYTVEFFNSKSIRKTSGLVGTGFVMQITKNQSIYKSYTLSINGDLNGDGNITIGDTQLLGKYFMNSTTLTQAQYISSDINNDGIINGVDILKIARNNL